MKVESLVIVDQHATVNLYLGLVLPARHALEVEWIRSLTVLFSIFVLLLTSLCEVRSEALHTLVVCCLYPALGTREKKRERL